MPPAVSSSEDNSESESSAASETTQKPIPARPGPPLLPEQVEMVIDKPVEKDETENEESGGDEEEGEEEDEELYIVEKILDHSGEFPNGEIRYEVKWKGYEAKKDRTWENEDNLGGARDILEEYWDKIGGKPQPGSSKKSSKKRSHQSNGTPDTAKKQKRKSNPISISPDAESTPASEKQKGRGRKSKLGFGEQDLQPESDRKKKRSRRKSGAREESPDSATENGYADDDAWVQPKAGPGAWEYEVQCVDTIELTDQGKWAYLMWNARDKHGKNRRTKALLKTVYECCPQRMLKFYENHLEFKEVPG